MNLKRLLLVLVIVPAGAARAGMAPTIAHSCPAVRAIGGEKQIKDLRASVQDAACRYGSGAKGILDTADSVLEILKDYPEDHSVDEATQDAPQATAGQKEKSRQLREKIAQLGRGITELRRAHSNAPAGTPLGKRLRELSLRYDTPQKRRANPALYLAELKATLALTDDGRKVLACWNAVRGPLFAGEQLFLIAPGSQAPFTAQFNVREVLSAEKQKKHDELKKSGAVVVMGGTAPVLAVEQDYPGVRDLSRTQYRKSITLNPEGDPVETLHTLAHEMRHGCDAATAAVDGPEFSAAREQADLAAMECVQKEPAKGLEGCRKEAAVAALYDKAGVARKKKDLNSLLSECHAYSAQVSLFGELAMNDPGLLCNYYYRSGAFGDQVISSAEYFAAYQRSMLAGDFINRLGAEYAESGDYVAEDLFELKDGKIARTAAGVPVLHAETAEFLKRNGCAYVAAP